MTDLDKRIEYFNTHIIRQKTVRKVHVVVSLNHYKSLHLRKLKTLLDPLKKEFNVRIKEYKIPPLLWMELTIIHNTRLDMDNVTETVKPFVDCLRDCGVIADDTAKKWDCLIIKSDKTLPKNTVIFEIVGETKY
jgi:hypothetical protein